MATYGVSGGTQDEIDELRQEYRQKFDGEPPTPFDEQYCLAKIPHQPESYQGPDRYCKSQNTKQVGSSYICPSHGGAGHGNPENLDKLAGMTHGMKASREHLVEDFSDKDEALYEWVMNEWPRAYNIDFEENPAAEHDLHRLAVEIVRAERGRGYLLEEGEVREDPVRNEEGQVVVDENGEIITEKSAHYLTDMLDAQDRKLTKLEKELGITRKEQLRQDNSDSAVEAIQSFAELGSAFLDREGEEYDPDEW